jgi:hypothetical protein
VAPEIRFFRFVEQSGDCWKWIGTANRGYGHFREPHRRVYAHRWAYEFFRDEIPAGLQLDHLCRNTLCVNPWHLEPVTPQINTLRSEGVTADRARQEMCVNGHPFDLTLPGRRRCRTCANAASRRHKNRTAA